MSIEVLLLEVAVSILTRHWRDLLAVVEVAVMVAVSVGSHEAVLAGMVLRRVDYVAVLRLSQVLGD